MSVIRSAGLRGFPDEVASLGGDAQDLARPAGLDPAALDTDDLLVPDPDGVRGVAGLRLDVPPRQGTDLWCTAATALAVTAP